MLIEIVVWLFQVLIWFLICMFKSLRWLLSLRLMVDSVKYIKSLFLQLRSSKIRCFFSITVFERLCMENLFATQVSSFEERFCWKNPFYCYWFVSVSFYSKYSHIPARHEVFFSFQRLRSMALQKYLKVLVHIQDIPVFGYCTFALGNFTFGCTSVQMAFYLFILFCYFLQDC